MPDVTMIPVIASFFGVTTDELFDFNLYEVEKNVEAIVDEYSKYWDIDKTKAEQRALSTIMPSPMRVKRPLSAEPTLSIRMPVMPMAHPRILRRVRRSVLKNRQASNTNRKVPNELRMAARAPSLKESPI